MLALQTTTRVQAVVYKTKFDSSAKTCLRFNQGLTEFLANEIVKLEWDLVAGVASDPVATRDDDNAGALEFQVDFFFTFVETRSLLSHVFFLASFRE